MSPSITEAATEPSASSAPSGDGSEVLRLCNVRKSYGSVEVLKDVSLTVHDREVVAIMGSSGSGKSTLVRCVDQLHPIDGGSMYLDGQLLGYQRSKGVLRPLKTKDIVKQRRRMGMVFQDFNLFPHLTARQNVTEVLIRAHGRSTQDAEERADQVLERVGLGHLADRYPMQLSGGQQQRVAIARSMAHSPRIVLMDEPTSALDPELVGEVLDTIQDLAQVGRTMVIVTHELRFARDAADRCVFMEDGRVAEVAPPDQFFGDPQCSGLKQFLSHLSKHE
ncbi:amino acid ABC transporter ATP-binding protein [Nocardioides sp.]|uniref:amino acid ABC transporter ATP-binding protein n=1 Tax=Nocardioides sp. TaxID=35761 RepID=UPI003D11233F